MILRSILIDAIYDDIDPSIFVGTITVLLEVVLLENKPCVLAPGRKQYLKKSG